MKKILCVLFAIVLSLGIILSVPLTADADIPDTITQDGLKVSITSAKSSYEKNETFDIALSITNTNFYKVEIASIETILPENLSLKSGELSNTNLSLEPGETYTTAYTVKAQSTFKFLWAILITIGIIVIIGGIIIVTIIIIERKKAKTVVCSLLCFIMLFTMTRLPVLAAEDNVLPSITVQKSFRIDDKDFIVKSTVNYNITVDDDFPKYDQPVPEDIALLFGVDPDEYDSDNDGLNNYIEIFITGTDPTLKDSDENGVNDIDEDTDEDGLTNGEELVCGTELIKIDTDSDGLSDYKEVKETKTSPRKYDTDEDSLSDGDELELGLDPLVKKTDGTTLDSERKFTQELSTNNIEESLISEENDAIPSLTLTTNGNVNSRVVIASTASNNFSDSRAIIGDPIDVYGANLGSGTISFSLKKDDSAEDYVASKISYNTNLICKYNDDGSTEYLSTTYDKTSNCVSAPITDEGTYFVLNVKNLFDELGLVLPDSTATTTTLSASSVKTTSADTLTSVNAMAQADIVFLIDTTASMGDEINNVKENVQYFIDALKEKGVSAGLALIDYQDIDADGYDSTKVHKNGSSNWFYDMDAYKAAISNLSLGYGGDTPECAVDALETGRLLDMRPSAGKIFILVTDADYKVDNRYSIPSMEAEIQLLKNAGITCAVVSSSYDKSDYYNLYNETNGIWADINGDFYTELMTLADKIGSDIVGDGYWIYLDGPIPVPVRLDEEPKAGSTADTDKDGIYDIDELESITPTGEINLDDLITKVSQGVITGTDYGTIKMYKYKSSPIDADTDFDGIDDSKDTTPKSNKFKGTLHYDIDEKEYTCSIDFSMDYRKLVNGNNEIYSKDLSVLSILYASDIYDNVYVEFTSGATGGNDTPTTFGSILGLTDNKCYEIKSSDYSVDKDDITEFFVGHKNIIYNGTVTEVIIVSVRGTNKTNAEWSSNFDVGADTQEYYDAVGSDHPDWKNKENHKGFDVTANRVYSKLEEYINKYIDPGVDKSILVTGHSRGAAIANILGQMLEDNTTYTTYGYTFATPNNTTSSNADRYKNIYNIINEDDIIPYLPLEKWGFKNYGITKSISVESAFENKWFGAETGSWEWLTGMDYNNDGGTKRTLDCFFKIANCREDLYKLDTSKDGKVWQNNMGHITREGAEEELTELSQTLKDEKLYKFCELYIVGDDIYHVEINYSPAYLMQTLSNMTSETGPKLGRDVKGKYAAAKASFVASSGKAVVGGMTHPHLQPTYYLIAKNNFSSIY